MRTRRSRGTGSFRARERWPRTPGIDLARSLVARRVASPDRAERMVYSGFDRGPNRPDGSPRAARIVGR